MGNKRSLNEEELNRKRELDRNRKRQKSLLLTEEQLIEKRRANLKSQTKRRKNQTEVELLARRQADNVRHALYRENESEEQRIQRLTADNSSHTLRRENESEEQRIQRRTADNIRQIARRANETIEQNRTRVLAVRSSQILSQQRVSQQMRSELLNFDENNVLRHDCGLLNVKCQFCGALHFLNERPKDKKFSTCCSKGKIKLQKPIDGFGNVLKYPELLKDLMINENNPFHSNFIKNIRNYNSAMSFASMGATTVNMPGYGPYVFKVQGQTYHRTSHVEPVNNQSPKFAQLYIMDSNLATDERMSVRENDKCLQPVMQILDNLLRRINRYLFIDIILFSKKNYILIIIC